MEDRYVGIITSANDKVDDYHKCIARTTAMWLANMDYNLIFGGGSKSMSFICYDAFSKKDRKIYAVTTKYYQDDLKKLPKAKPLFCETTFDMKKRIFENSDLIVVLPGGIGTFSELLSFIEENREREEKVPIEIYDENGDGFFKQFFEMLKSLVKMKFVDVSIFDSFKVSHNKDEFIDHILQYEKIALDKRKEKIEKMRGR